MKRVDGKVIVSDDITIDGLEIFIYDNKPTSTTLGTWGGTCDTSGFFGFDNCVLVLNDGRKGKIIADTPSSFVGSGPLL